MFTVGQALPIVLLLNALFAWWLFRYGREWWANLKGLCPGCFSKDGMCVCRPDLERDEPEPEWSIDLTLWEDMPADERAEAERADEDDRDEAGAA